MREYLNVDVRRQDGVTIIRLHTLDKSLCWSVQAELDLIEVFESLQFDTATRVVVITGTESEWCTQLDTEGFAALPWSEISSRGVRLLSALQQIPVPVVAAVNGPVTVHSEIPMMADIVLAASHVVFADHAHFTRGVVPGDGVNQVWNRAVGHHMATYHLMTGRALPVAEAHRLGIVSEVVDSADLMTRAIDLAKDLSANSRELLSYTKTALSLDTHPDLRGSLTHGFALQGCAHGSRRRTAADGQPC